MAESRPPTGWIECGVASCPAPGETDIGDRAMLYPSEHGTLIAVVDGLGHGADAASAAQAALDTLGGHAHESIVSLVGLCHTRLRGTRGVVMSLASVSVNDGTLTWVGVGNVEGLLLRAHSSMKTAYESLLLHGGIVGVHLPPLHPSVISIMKGDTLLFVTDGVGRGFLRDLPLPGPPQSVADHIVARHSKAGDDRLVLVARYTGR